MVPSHRRVGFADADPALNPLTTKARPGGPRPPLPGWYQTNEGRCDWFCEGGAEVEVKISKAAFEAIQAHGAEGYPNEICGILVGPPSARTATEARRARNVVVDRPHDRYKIDDRDHMRIQREADSAGLEIVGYYHSHPDHPAQPSETDAKGSWAGYFYVIVSVEKGAPVTTNAFVSERDLAGPFMPEPLEVV